MITEHLVPAWTHFPAPNFHHSAMVSQVNTSFFQTIESIDKNKIIIRDKLYGEHTVTEPVLIELFQCPELCRLKGVCQLRVTALLGFSPKVTRFEHSDGAFVLVRKVGASVEEQAAANLEALVIASSRMV